MLVRNSIRIARLLVWLLAFGLSGCQTVESIFNFDDDGIAVQTEQGICKLVNPEQQMHAVAICDYGSEVVLKLQRAEVRWRKADLQAKLLETIGVQQPELAQLGTFSFYLKVFVFHPDQRYWFVVNQNRENPIGFLLNLDPGHWKLQPEHVRTLPPSIIKQSLAAGSSEIDGAVAKMLDPDADCSCYQTLAFELRF